MSHSYIFSFISLQPSSKNSNFARPSRASLPLTSCPINHLGGVNLQGAYYEIYRIIWIISSKNDTLHVGFLGEYLSLTDVLLLIIFSSTCVTYLHMPLWVIFSVCLLTFYESSTMCLHLRLAITLTCVQLCHSDTAFSLLNAPVHCLCIAEIVWLL
jgi:hypothetical protein